MFIRADSWFQANLKKQTQFFGGLNSVRHLIIMAYGYFGVPQRQKNKANLSLREQSQFVRTVFSVLRSPGESLRTAYKPA